MQSLFNSDQHLEDRPAVSSPPWVWFGFVFAIAFLVAEFTEAFLDLDKESFQLIFVMIVLAGWIYWLFCVHRFHKILAEMTRHRYPIQPGEAVGKHFIPFYNLYWLFVWLDPFIASQPVRTGQHVARRADRFRPADLVITALCRRSRGAGVNVHRWLVHFRQAAEAHEAG